MNDTAFISASRESARSAFQSAVLPARTGHAWRYTDPAAFLPAAAVSPSAEQGSRDGGQVHSTGAAHIIPSTLPDGIRVVRFQDASDADARIIGAHLGTAVASGDGKIEAFDLATWQDGILISVEPGIASEDPLFLSTDPGTGPFGSVRLLVVAGEGSMITLVDDYIGGPDSPFMLHSTVEIFAGPSSCVRYAAMQELSPGATFHLKQRARAGADSTILTSIFSFGAGTARADMGTILEGRGASSQAFGVIVGSGKQHFDHHTVHLHRAPGTRSNFDFRSILTGHSRSIYTGSIVIEGNAGGCEAYQVNRNLMLSDDARADSIPELEIKNDDVRCSHGAATGPVEPAQVFYLMARGIPEREAVRLIAAGFAESLFQRVPPAIRDRARARLEKRLEST